MHPFASVMPAVPSVVVSLLTDARVQVAFALTVAVLLSLLLGSGEAAAGWSTSPG